MKIKIKDFKCPKSIKKFGKKIMLGTSLCCWVGLPIDPASQHIIILEIVGLYVPFWSYIVKSRTMLMQLLAFQGNWCKTELIPEWQIWKLKKSVDETAILKTDQNIFFFMDSPFVSEIKSRAGFLPQSIVKWITFTIYN